MAVIIREKRKIGGEYVEGVKVYKTVPGKFLTKEEREKAEKLDLFISKKMEETTKEIKKMGLLGLKNKKGVLRLWYEVGRRLSFAMDTDIVPAEDREFVWRAFYDHARELSPGAPKTRATGPRNHFIYCYKISRFPWKFINAAGTWSAWVEFLDSERIREDERIIHWLCSQAENTKIILKRGWLRKLNKAIRQSFKSINTKIAYPTNKELFAKLDGIFEKIFNR